jgi:peptide/nickel transport system permease protein
VTAGPTAVDSGPLVPPAPRVVRSHSPLSMALGRLRRDRFAIGGGLLVLAMIVLALAAPLVAPNDPYAIDPLRRLAPVGTPGYPLGGDELGRCLLTRLLWGARASLLIAFVPSLVAMLVGVACGAVAGYVGGPVDEILMRVLDVLLAFPGILLALGIAASLGPGLENIILSLTVVGVPIFGRLTRGAVLSVRERAFVEAARALGAGDGRLLARHVLPNVLAPIVVYFTLQCGRTVIAGTGLSFLGLGAPAPAADWGGMLAAGQQVLPIAPHVATIPGLAIFALTVALNLFGDGLNDAFDPTQKA